MKSETYPNTNLSEKSIQIIHQPTVYLIGRQLIVQEELDRFFTEHQICWESDSEIASEVLTEVSGRVCYLSFQKPRPGGNSAYLNHIKEAGHGSVLEHAVWSFLVTGVSRSLTHELIRHRSGWSYSQLSQRYVDESVAEYVEPDIIAKSPILHQIWLEAMQHAHQCYLRLVDELQKQIPYEIDSTTRRKLARQAARSVLPNSTETKIFITANARALRHFLEQRGSRYAEPEIRKLANHLLDILQKESPNLFNDYEKIYLPDGTWEIVTQYRKV